MVADTWWSSVGWVRGSWKQSLECADTACIRAGPTGAGCAGEATPEREGSGGLVPDNRRAHLGSVAAAAARGSRVWTSGGESRAATLAEWGAEGTGRAIFALGQLGALFASPSCCMRGLGSQLMYAGTGWLHIICNRTHSKLELEKRLFLASQIMPSVAADS